MKSWWMLGIVLIGVFVVGQSQSSAPAESKREGTMVKYFSKEDLTAAFAKGATLSEQSNYKVIAAGRSDAGTPEAHKNFIEFSILCRARRRW